MKVWNSKYWGSKRALFPLGKTVTAPVVAKPGGAILVQVQYPAQAGVSTGRCAKLNESVAQYFIEVKRSDGKLGWVWNAQVTEAQPLSTATGNGGDGEVMMKRLVANDQNTMHRLFNAYEFRRRALNKGVQDTTLDTRLTSLVSRYNTRQVKIKNSGLVKFTASVRKGYEWARDLFTKAISGPQVGVVPLIPIVIAVSAVSLLGASYLIYKTFHPDEVQSQKDLQEAMHLHQQYLSMSEEQKKFVDEQVEKGYDNGREAGMQEQKNSGGILDTIKNNILLIGGGIVAFNYLQSRKR